MLTLTMCIPFLCSHAAYVTFQRNGKIKETVIGYRNAGKKTSGVSLQMEFNVLSAARV